MRKKTNVLMLSVALASCSEMANASCGAAFCTLNSDWGIQGAWEHSGTRLDLRYEWVRQGQLRSGTAKAAAAGIADTHDEVKTLNRNTIATLDHSLDSNWGIALRLPVVARKHEHIHNDPINGAQPETWKFSALGDVQLLGLYRFDPGHTSPASAGLRFGVKLPTGSIAQRNAGGELAERSLQPGSGSTDVVAGAFYGAPGAPGGNWFSQIQWQHAVAIRDNYRPGDTVSLDAGYAQALTTRLQGLLQLNLRWKDRDSGSNAEPADSGGEYAHISPGLAFAVSKDTRLYGFVQLPLYQSVRGTQLTADWTAAAGVNVRF
ncbi:hypothetical protein [Sulfuriferula plumbiphila]|nr:hypothetical protein [Sulfuriferula plumbiphila]